ncbi:Sister chromatid cohesion protein PDS5-like protein B-A, partial [Stegodyphus mimosarum]
MLLKLPLDFMAIFSLGGLEKTRELKAQFKQYLLSNINKRREYLKQNPLTTVKLYSYLPDYVLPYAIHLLAHDPAFKKYDDVPSLIKLKDCLWFLMEPLMKHENYSFSFFKRLLEGIKQTKDKQAPNDDIANLKLYAVSDLALSLVISKTTNFVVKEYPVEPNLPTKLFTEQDKTYCNLKTYLPQELIVNPPKKSGLELEMLFANARSNARKSMGNSDCIAIEGSTSSQPESLREEFEIDDPLGHEVPEENSHESQDMENHYNKSVLSSETENSQNSSVELKNTQSVVDVPNVAVPAVKRPRGRPRRQNTVPTTTATGSSSASVEPESEMCENTPPNSVDKRKTQSEGESQSEGEPESKRQRIEDDIEETRLKYQQYWEKHCPARMQTKLVDTSMCGQNKDIGRADKSSRSDEQDAR